MKYGPHTLIGLALGIAGAVYLGWPAYSQSNFSVAQLYCYIPGPPANWAPCSSTNPLQTSGGGGGGGTATPISTTALASSLVVKAAPGALASFNVSADATLSASAWWVMIYNATAAPADGAVTPAKCYAMPSGTTSYSAGFPTAITLSVGIVIGVSTSGCFTKTASAHAFISGDFE